MSKLNLGVKSKENPQEYRKRYNTYKTCECGCFVKKYTYYNHIKTPKHKFIMDFISKQS